MLALGDTSYTHFCRCGKSLDAAWVKAGGKQLAPGRDVDKEDWPVVDTWIAAVVEGLGGLNLKTIADMGGERRRGREWGEGEDCQVEGLKQSSWKPPHGTSSCCYCE